MLITDPTTDPFFNLAAEEYLLREVAEPVLRLWRNTPCVVIGRHQIPCLEVNLVEAHNRNVPILRRLSGGGAVYHDLGNINFTLITPLEKGQGIDFDRMLAPIVSALNALGIAAVHVGRGDVRVDGLKISGNAAYIWKNRLLHHGTLLWDANLDALEAMLDVSTRGQFQGKSVRSIRSRVVNLSAIANERFSDVGIFIEALSEKLAPLFGETAQSARSFTQTERLRIEEIADATYRTPEWNLGSAPDYALERPMLRLAVREGRISDISVENDTTASRALSNALNGQWHTPATVEAALKNLQCDTIKLPPLSAFF